jgi:hypothetical protein
MFSLSNNGQMTEYELVDSPKSANPNGFESFILPSDITDEVYYVIINFVDGSTGAERVLHMSHGSQYGTHPGGKYKLRWKECLLRTYLKETETHLASVSSSRKVNVRRKDSMKKEHACRRPFCSLFSSASACR